MGYWKGHFTVTRAAIFGRLHAMARDLLDLHSRKVDEILELLDRFLTRANDAGLSQVRIMTGKGTGAVRAKTMELLKQAHYSWKYERLPNGKDNEGVLVVRL